MEKQYLDPYEAINTAYDEMLALEVKPVTDTVVHPPQLDVAGWLGVSKILFSPF